MALTQARDCLFAAPISSAARALARERSEPRAPRVSPDSQVVGGRRRRDLAEIGSDLDGRAVRLEAEILQAEFPGRQGASASWRNLTFPSIGDSSLGRKALVQFSRSIGPRKTPGLDDLIPAIGLDPMIGDLAGLPADLVPELIELVLPLQAEQGIVAGGRAHDRVLGGDLHGRKLGLVRRAFEMDESPFDACRDLRHLDLDRGGIEGLAAGAAEGVNQAALGADKDVRQLQVELAGPRRWSPHRPRSGGSYPGA